MTAEAVVDTSVLLDAIVEQTQRHSQAREQLAGLTKIRVPSVVLYELVWVLHRLGVPPEAVRSAVEALLQNSKVTVASDDGRFTVRAIGRIVDEKLKLSDFDDKVVLETALKERLPLITYDKELEREARKAEIEARRRA
ncbi:MAG: PIN domain-containing protein [Nitrososphaerales archaeon]|nr:PIN domain-containing protein [Nitrososphaerales archaeon]